MATRMAGVGTARSGCIDDRDAEAATAKGRLMSMILTIAGIFAGIGVFLATMYSLSQVLLLRGEGRLMHGLSFGLILAVMAALMEREVGLARLLAVPLFLVAARTLMLERGWYRIMPLLVIIFTVVLMLGYVALN